MSAYLEYEGKPVPARDLSWYLVGPCGCSAGVTVAEMPYGGEIRATPEQAADAMHETAAHRKKAEDEGWTMQLGLRSEVVERVGKCPHSPRYGVEPRVALEGYSWVVAGRGKRDHLVDSDDLANVVSGKVAALCGADAYHFSWSTEWLSDLECARCERRARSINETQGTLDVGGAA